MRTKLGEVISEYSVRNKKDEDIPVYSVTNEKGFCTGYFSKDVASKDRTTYKKVPYGYFAYNPSRINVGSVDWQHCEEQVIVSPLYVVFKVDDTVDRRYLLHYLKSDIARTLIKAHASGSVRDNLKLSVLQEFPINLRPKEEQKKISDILDKVDVLRALYAEQLRDFDHLVKSRFIELFEDGRSPIKIVEELCSEIIDCPHTTPKYEGELKNPAIRTSEIKKGYITWDSMRYVSDEEYGKRTSRLRPEAGDIVYGREGTFGNAAVLPEGYKFCLGQRVMLLRPDYNKCTSEYLLHAVISDDVYRQALEKNNASTVAHVNVKDVKQFRVPLPSFEKQNLFTAFVAQVDKSRFIELFGDAKNQMQMSEVCLIITDGTHQPPKFKNEGIPFIFVSNITEDKLIYDAEKYIDQDTYDELIKRTPIEIGDVLLSTVGSYGHPAVVKTDKKFLFQRHIAYLKPKRELINSDYLHGAILSSDVQEQIENAVKGIAQKTLNLSEIKKMVIPVPSMIEQEKFAAFVTQVDKSRFIELFGDLASPDCRWELEKFVDICVKPDGIKCGPFGTQLSKDEYHEKGVAVWEIAQINSGFTTMPTHYLTEEKAKQLHTYSIRPGDIAMSRKGNVGRCAVFPQSFNSGIIHSDVLRIRIDTQCVLPVFMMHQLHYSKKIQHQIDRVSSGAIMAGINVTKLKNIEVHLPPLALQQRFAAFVTQVDKSKYYSRKCIKACQKTAAILKQEWMLFLHKGIPGGYA